MRPSRARLSAVLAVAALTVGAAAVAAAPRVDPSSLPTVSSGARPGPDVLYASPPRAPQLENTGAWRAAPILVSGAHSYRDGEWLYQDFLYDDHGATGVPDPGTPYGPGDHLYSPSAGTFTYPKDAAFAHNGADLVELRVRPVAGATAFRVTLNTLQDPERTAFTLALGDGPSTAWPHGAGVSGPARAFVTWHGGTAELRDALTGAVSPVAPQVRVDLERRQVEVVVPRQAFDPGRSALRTTVGVGLWDPAAGTYLAPQPGPASETTPGGGSPTGTALVNVGPRLAEPQPVIAGATMADTAAGAAALAPWWRERQQSLQLTAGDVTPFAVEVDLGKLVRGVRDDSGVPATGSLNRILASRNAFGQGLDLDNVCFDIAGGVDVGAQCVGRFVGQLQPYTLYVPAKPEPARGYGLTLLLHSLSANYNQYATTRNQTQLGDRGEGSLVLTPAGRGADGFYAGYAEADTFEAWADVARHYRLDPEWTTVSGYSMGGFGTFRLLARYPDLFARGFSVVGDPGSVGDQLASLRHTPLMQWGAAGDELVHVSGQREMVAALTQAGVRFEHRTFLTADHLTLAGNDQYAEGAAFLGTHRVDRNPSHVNFVVDPREDNAGAQVVADKAYWVSGLRVRDAQAGTGAVEATSHAFGHGDAPVLPVATGAGVMTGGQNQAMAYTRESREWGGVRPATPAQDRLTVRVHNLSRVVVDPVRARISCRAAVDVVSDGPVTVELAGCRRTVTATGS
jgi:hypothetical protein